MKKIYFFVSVALATTGFSQTVTFEDLGLAANSHWNGSDSSGGFTSNNVFFENQYNHQWDYWSGGFIYSSSTDNTTAGYTNDFSSITGSGSMSSTYSVNYGGNIDFGTLKTVSSIDITNNTYAYFSMRDGDSFGKKFGSPNAANGQPDGTNGEDWFKVTITGMDANSQVTGTIDFYLADFRFVDSTQDYIVDTWETVDLSSLGTIQFLNFELTSSDVGGFGMNTPAYFALDNLTYGNLAISDNELTKVAFGPNPANEYIQFNTNEFSKIRVIDLSGKEIYNGNLEANGILQTQQFASGVYQFQLVSETGFSNGTFQIAR